MIVNIIVNILAIFVNWIITVSLIGLLHSYFHFKMEFLLPYVKPLGINSISTEYVPMIITGLLMVTLTAISFTPIADFILRGILGFRKPLTDEREKLHTLFESVCVSANKNLETYSLYIVDEDWPNAYALGISNVAVTRRLLMDYPDDEIKGVMAHELGHLHYGDAVYSRVFMTVSIIGQIALIIYHFIANFCSGFARIRIPFISLFALLINWCVSLQIWLFELLLIVPLTFGAMFGSRQCEYRADKYACQIGHGEGLYLFLYRILDMNDKNKGFLSILRATHPPTAERIRKIDKIKQKESFINPGVSNINV